MSNSHHSLNDIRLRLDVIDDKLLKLLSERRKLSIEIAKDKEKASKAIRDPDREQQLLSTLIKSGESLNLNPEYITRLFNIVIEDSVQIQQDYFQHIANSELNFKITARVAYLGSKGSYSHLATQHYFNRKNQSLIELQCKTFKEIIKTVESKHADYGVLPIENTSSGSINEVYDLLQNTSLYIVGELTLPIEHCLVATTDTTLDTIKTLYSHFQPYQQCSEFLSTLKDVEQIPCSSSADAMLTVKKINSPNVAAIGSVSSAKLYGLQPIISHISNQTENYTRFILVAKKAIKVSEKIPAKTALIISTAQDTGTLVESLLIFKKYSINIIKLESRPIIGNPWEEMFYIDLQTHLNSHSMQSALKELTATTRYLKVLGCYPAENKNSIRDSY